MSDLVSILIPAHNAQAWLAETIQSAVGQTWPRKEVIVVDDGSTDATREIAHQFESASVKVVSQKNAGAAAARNRALDVAQGTYIQWLDADDLLDRGKVSAQMRVAAEMADPVRLLSGPFGTFYYRPAKAVFTPTALWRDLSRIEYFLTRFTDNVYFQTGAWLVSRRLSDVAGRWCEDGSPDDDGEYFCRVVLGSSGVKFVSDARTYYRIGNSRGLSQARAHSAQSALFHSKAACISYLLSLEDSERTRAASVRLLQDWLPTFYAEREDLIREAHQLAQKLGGRLDVPRVKAKYRLLEWLFGPEVAIRASLALPRLRERAARKWDGLLHRRTEAE
jgi:glycosyltransferase involved in cell wall biosynthesis